MACVVGESCEIDKAPGAVHDALTPSMGVYRRQHQVAAYVATHPGNGQKLAAKSVCRLGRPCPHPIVWASTNGWYSFFALASCSA